MEPSIASLPLDTLREHLVPFLGVTQVIYLSETSKGLYRILTQNDEAEKGFADAVWKRFSQHRWKNNVLIDETATDSSVFPINYQHTQNTTSTNPSVWYKHYVRRHKNDVEVLRRLIELSRIKRSEGNPPSSLWLASIENQRDEDIDILLQIASKGGSYPLELNISQMLNPRTRSYPIELFAMSLEVLAGINRFSVCQELHLLNLRCMSMSEDEDATSSNDDEPIYLEHGAILIAKYHLEDLELTQYYREGTSSFMEKMEYYLDAVAKKLEKRLKQRLQMDNVSLIDDNTGNHRYSVQIIFEEMQYFFRANPNQSESSESSSSSANDIRPFSGNVEDYYNIDNSLLYRVIESRKGIPITLAVIYTAIVRRATGLKMDAVGMPGHFLISTQVPVVINQNGTSPLTNTNTNNNSNQIFIDPFQGGAILTVNEIKHMLATNFGIFDWQESFTQPIEYPSVWQRMLRNILNIRTALVGYTWEFLYITAFHSNNTDFKKGLEERQLDVLMLSSSFSRS